MAARKSLSHVAATRARYYTSLSGRFVSADPPFIDQHPGNPQSWNLYHYARNNPLRMIDPSGNASLPAESHMPIPDGIGVNSFGNSTCQSCWEYESSMDNSEAFAAFDIMASQAKKVKKGQQQSEGSISVTILAGINPVTGEIFIQSAASLAFALSTSERLSQGTSTLTVALLDEKNHEKGKSNFVLGIESHVENIEKRIVGQQTTTSTTVKLAVIPISSHNNFGVSGPARLKFTITDSQNKRFTGMVNVSVHAPSGGTGHRKEIIRSNRITFNVP